MIESLRRFSVTKLLSSPALSLSASALFRFTSRSGCAGEKKREEVLQILTTRVDDEGGKRCNVISGRTILKPLLFQVAKTVE